MNTGDSSSSVWPGYVAAVSSLVLSLLLLAGVVAAWMAGEQQAVQLPKISLSSHAAFSQ